MQPTQVDPDVAFCPRLRRVDLDLALGTLRIFTPWDGYLEMTSINDAYQGRRHRYVYGYHSVFEPGTAPGQAPSGSGSGGADGGGGKGGGQGGSQASAVAPPPVDAPQIGVAKVDAETREVEVWLPGACQFALEPKFVARPGAEAEDDGWLLCMLFDSGAPLLLGVCLTTVWWSAGPLLLRGTGYRELLLKRDG